MLQKKINSMFKSAKSHVKTILFLAIVIGVPFLFMYHFSISVVSFKHVQMRDILDLFAVLLIISLFVERTLEGIISAWRAPEARMHDLKHKMLQSEIVNLEQANYPDPKAMQEKLEKLKEQHEQHRQTISAYKSQTQILAIRGGLMMGIIISLIGFRTLESLVDISTFVPIQITLFRWIDVILTGCVIAGGSDGIHQITSVFTSFMDATKSKTDK